MTTPREVALRAISHAFVAVLILAQLTRTARCEDAAMADRSMLAKSLLERISAEKPKTIDGLPQIMQSEAKELMNSYFATTPSHFDASDRRQSWTAKFDKPHRELFKVVVALCTGKDTKFILDFFGKPIDVSLDSTTGKSYLLIHYRPSPAGLAMIRFLDGKMVDVTYEGVYWPVYKSPKSGTSSTQSLTFPGTRTDLSGEKGREEPSGEKGGKGDSPESGFRGQLPQE